MNELNLIQSAKQGDQEAFCQLYGLYKDRLYRYAYYRLGNREDAEDAVSDCVLGAWRKLGDLRADKAFPAWIFRILSGCVNGILRRRIQEEEKVAQMTEEASASAGAAAGAAAEGRAPAADQPSATRLELEEALALLSEQERDIVLMAVVGGLKSQEIADVTGLTAGSVRSRLSRSLQKMRKYLEE